MAIVRDLGNPGSVVDAHLNSPVNVSSMAVLTDGITAPAVAAGRALIYVDTTDGDLKVKFPDGVTKVIAADT